MPIWLIVVIVIVLILAIWVIGCYNKLVRGKNDCEEAFSTMDVYMKKRYDLIPNFVETVKGYAKHESETLEKVIAARNAAASSNASLEERAQNENILSGAMRQLFALTEAYPDLKANTNFLDLQNQLSSIEAEIANSRKYYNAVAKGFNNIVMMFPGSIIAGMFNFNARSMFEVDDESERKNVKVQF